MTCFAVDLSFDNSALCNIFLCCQIVYGVIAVNVVVFQHFFFHSDRV